MIFSSLFHGGSLAQSGINCETNWKTLNEESETNSDYRRRKEYVQETDRKSGHKKLQSQIERIIVGHIPQFMSILCQFCIM